MRRNWSANELIEHWSLLPDEKRLLGKKTSANRLVFSVLLKFFQYADRFPENAGEVPKNIVNHLATQVKISPEHFDSQYDWNSRIARDHKAAIREFLGFRLFEPSDTEKLEQWLAEQILPREAAPNLLEDAIHQHLRAARIELPNQTQIEQCIRRASLVFEEKLFIETNAKLSGITRQKIDALLASQHKSYLQQKTNGYDAETISLSALKRDPRQASLDTVLSESAKIKRIQALGLPDSLFSEFSTKVLQKYRQRVMMETPSQIQAHPNNARYALVSAFCYLRNQTIVDGLTDLLIQITHKIASRAENQVIKTLMNDLRKVQGKTELLYRLAQAAVDHPEGIVNKVLYPVVGEQTLKDLVKEFKSTGTAYQQQVHSTMRASYSNHYRRMLSPILNTLEFQANNEIPHPVLNALKILKKYANSKLIYYPPNEEVPLEGIVRNNVYTIVVEQDNKGQTKINRINYEMAVLQALRDRLRCKEIWIKGAYRYRNPDEDLPLDFDEKRETYYQLLKQPVSAEIFVSSLKNTLQETLIKFNQGIPKNTKVSILTKKNGWISLSPLKPQPEPIRIDQLKAEIAQTWSMTSLLDILKEVDIQVDITSQFKSAATREILDKETLQKRLLLCLFGLGTNTGLKRISSGNPGVTYEDLRYIRRRFMHKDYLRQAISKIANAIFSVRDPSVWGEATVACASDSKKFGAWNQNLMTEWHVRYGGRGIMIYWHVEKKSACICSQLKSCSSSEVAAMFEGVLRHCTDMTVEKNYVDSHGQSEVGFAFSYLLNFDLLPRLKDIGSQKLYYPDSEKSDAFSHLKPVLARAIKWDLIQDEYDQMIKYATALRLGTADAESILRRFTRHNRKYPTYQALSELGKAVKTIFLCRYLHSETLRQEIHEGLNVVERWNSVNGFIFYGKGGDIATNSREDQELSMLCLHLLQICLVFINTLMIQQILAKSAWHNRLTNEDKRALTPLIHAHINPYGLFLLDMGKRLPLAIRVQPNV